MDINYNYMLLKIFQLLKWIISKTRPCWEKLKLFPKSFYETSL